MSLLSIFSVLITVAALFAYVNHRTLGLPTTIGIMAISLVFSLVLVAFGNLGLGGAEDIAVGIVSQIEFDDTLLNGMLGFLLFAGALHVNLDDLLARKLDHRHAGLVRRGVLHVPGRRRQLAAVPAPSASSCRSSTACCSAR